MKSVLLTDAFAPEIGGIQTYLRKVCECLGPSVHVICFGIRPPAMREEQNGTDSFRVERIRRFSRPPGNPFIVSFDLARLFLIAVSTSIKEQVELIQCSGVSPIGIVGWLTSFVTRRPYIVYVYGMDLLTLIRNRIWKAIAVHVLSRAELVVTISQYMKRNIVRLGITEQNIFVLHPFIDTEFFRPLASTAERRKLIGVRNKSVLLTVARLVRRKRVDTVIRLLPAILSEFPDVVYVVVGDGPEREPLIHLSATLNLVDKVRFLNGNGTPEIYNACDVFIMVSSDARNVGEVEGFGIVFIEASACGKVVIGSRKEGIPDAILHNRTGLLVDPDSPDEILGSIKRLLSNHSLMTELGKNGREWVVRDFGMRMGCSNLEVMLESLSKRAARQKSRMYPTWP